MDTDTLLKKCVDKDPSAWDEFTRQYSALVTRSVIYKLRSFGISFASNDVTDIVQEIFLSIWEKDKVPGVRKSECVKGWLAMVSINQTANYCRKHIFKTIHNTHSLEEALPGNDPTRTLGSILSSSKLNTGAILESDELKDIIEKEMSSLGYTQQLALKFSIYDGKKQREIAEIMNMPEGTVATLISRGKKQLKERLEKLLRN